MVGLVVSDNSLLTACWSLNEGIPTLDSIVEVPYTEPILPILHDEAE